MTAHETRSDLSHITDDPTTMARFQDKVQVGDPDDCWPWPAARNPKGYGQFGSRGRYVLAHRIAYAAVHGEIPEGHMVLHSCDSPSCCNPAHLRAGSALDNARDCVARGRQCRGAKNGRAKLDEARVRALLELAWQGWSSRELAAEFEVTARQVTSITSGAGWKHVARPVAVR